MDRGKRIAVFRRAPPSIADPNLERAKNLATIFSAVAIPIVLTVAGYFIQRQLADEGLKKDYVGIATGILKENPANQEPELRDWAIKVLDGNSPVPFSGKAKASLLAGSVVMPGPAFVGPPESCMSASPKRTVLAEVDRLAKDAKNLDMRQLFDRYQAFLELVVKQEKGALITQANLDCVQKWMRFLEEGDKTYRAAIGAPSSTYVMDQYKKEQAAQAASAASTPNLRLK